MLTHVLIGALVNGAIYALFASGLALLFGVARVISVVHGSFFMLGAYFMYMYTVLPGGPQFSYAVGFVASIATAALVAWIMHRLLIRPLVDRPIAIMLITLGLAYTIQEVVRLVFGSRPRSVPALASGATDFLGLGVLVQTPRVVALVGSLLFLACIGLYLGYTRMGKAIMAVAQDREAALLVGIRSEAVLAAVFVAGSVLAAFAGLISAPFLAVTPTLWLGPLVKAFAVVILGGLGSLKGTVVAAFIIAFAEAVVQFYGSPQFSEVVPFALIVLILVLRPYGLFGRLEYT